MTNQEAIKVLRDMCDGLESSTLKDLFEEEIPAINMAIEALKVDLVRCGECKYQDKGENEREAWNLCAYRPWIYKPISDDYFCGDGERRSDED